MGVVVVDWDEKFIQVKDVAAIGSVGGGGILDRSVGETVTRLIDVVVVPHARQQRHEVSGVESTLFGWAQVDVSHEELGQETIDDFIVEPFPVAKSLD